MPGLGLFEAIIVDISLAILLLWGIYALSKNISILFREFFSKNLTDPYPFSYNEGKHVVTAIFTKPIRIHRKKEFVLVLLGDLTESDIPQIEQDITAGISTAYYKLLQKCNRDIDEVLEFTYNNYQPFSQEVFYYGLMLGELISVYNIFPVGDVSGTGIGVYYTRGVKLKGLKWVFIRREILRNRWGLPCIKEKKYRQNGKVIIKFRFKKKKSSYIIPIELVKIWKHVKWSSDLQSKGLTLQLYQYMEKIKFKPSNLSDYDNIPTRLILPYRGSIKDLPKERQILEKLTKEILQYRRKNFKTFNLYPPLQKKK